MLTIRSEKFFLSSASWLALFSSGGILALPVWAFLSSSPAFSQTINWTGNNSSDWNTAENWDTDTVPPSPGNATVRINTLSPNITTASGVTFSGGTINIANTAGASGTLEIINGSSFQAGTVSVGAAGVGSLIVSGTGTSLSILNNNTHLNIGSNAGGNGIVEILNGATVSAYNVTVGNQRGAGSLLVDGEDSLLHITGRDLSVSGRTGGASVEVRNGGQIVINGTSGWLQLESRNDTVTTLLLTGQGSRIRSDGYGLIGQFGTVTARVEEQAVLDVGASLIVGVNEDTTGHLTVDSQAHVTAAEDIVIGLSGGQGELTLTGEGVLDSIGDVYIANGPQSTGILNIGAAAGEQAATAGILHSPSIQFGSGTGAVVFNHSGTSDGGVYDFGANLIGTGLIDHYAGFTRLTSDSSDFSGTTTIYGGTMQIQSMLGGDMIVQEQGRLQGNGIVGDTVNRGTIAPGLSIGGLTIEGDYTGDNGRLEIEAVLGDDTSARDMLYITGSTSGYTTVAVLNVGGNGAQTANGIKIIDIGGSSEGVFELESMDMFEGERVVFAGAYGYRLYKNELDTPDFGDWYLRSAPITGTETPLFQRGAPIYEAYGSVLQAFNRLDTLRQRTGGRAYSEGQRNSVSETANAGINSGVWARIEGSHKKMGSARSTTHASYDADFWSMQAGVDHLLMETDQGELIGGLSARYGQVSADIASLHGNGSIKSDGYGIGGGLTWYGDTGFYADAQAQATWYRSDLRTDFALTPSVANDHKGFGYAVSLEGGKSFAIGEQWSLIPQAQLAYSYIELDSFRDPIDALVAFRDNESLLGRLGLMVEFQSLGTASTGTSQPATVYGIANLYHEFLDGNAAFIDGVRFTRNDSRTWGGLGVGGSYKWNDDQYSLYGEGSFDTALSEFGDDYAFKGTVGLRVKW